MAWVVPRVWVVGEIATAAKLNEISTDLNDLDRRTSSVGAVVDGAEGTASTSYTDVATAGPAVATTIGSTGKALVAIACNLNSSLADGSSFMSYALSGSTVLAADDGRSIAFRSPTATGGLTCGRTDLLTGLVAGSTTATAKYHASGAGATSTFSSRRLTMTPLGA